ncbi:uncharacterized protein LOC124361850 isoform X3 [Homalodisca vitripennis]|uniref:Uncharacterized protein n=1 Tax=Homalodisca liturata TaxID=320908 RepID=A0A1B6K708_9HEMI|nr:uncharacterized protein LOC124361850 isoform X2 [Homalodisca vitripennis]XP_046671838.1 uncharacterized protein LOC124361850 isoform X3 [Homalodisca vitripennis]
MKRFCIQAVLLLTLFYVFAGTSGLGNGSGRGGVSSFKSGPRKAVYNGLGYANGDYQMKQFADGKPMQSSKPSRGIGMTAWGIIAVLAGSLLLGTILYYTVLFYPILCKKERKYDIMDLTPV